MRIKKLMVYGQFDCLTIQDIDLLRYAKTQASIVEVGLFSDSFFKAKNDWRTRHAIMESLKYPSKVFMFDTVYQLERIIEDAKPDILLVKKGEQIIGAEFAKNVLIF